MRSAETLVLESVLEKEALLKDLRAFARDLGMGPAGLSEILESTSLEERNFSSIQFRFSFDRMEEAKEDIERFRREFTAKYEASGEQPSPVYTIAVQFFPMIRIRKQDS